SDGECHLSIQTDDAAMVQVDGRSFFRVPGLQSATMQRELPTSVTGSRRDQENQEGQGRYDRRPLTRLAQGPRRFRPPHPPVAGVTDTGYRPARALLLAVVIKERQAPHQ